MKLKTKLTIGVSLLVLVVVLTVNLVYLAALVHEQTQEVYSSADFLCRAIYNEMNQELVAAHDTGRLRGDAATALEDFVQGLRQSPPLTTLFNSAIGYPVGSAIRDVALVAPDGTIVLDSNPDLMGQHQPQRRLLSEVVESSAWQQFKAIFSGDRTYDVALATEVGNRPLGTIAVGVDTVLLRSVMLGKIRTMAAWGALIVLLATALSLALSEFILSPLAAIRAQLNQLTTRGPLVAPWGSAAPRAAGLAPTAAGAAGGKIRRDEFGQVSTGIERLGQQIEDVRQIYTALQDNVSHLLRGMEEGLLLFDAQGRAVLASAAMPRLLRLPPGEIAGRSVEELFTGPSVLHRAVRLAVRQSEALPQREAEQGPGERPLQIRLEMVREGERITGSLLTIRDPEPARQLESELEVARRLTQLGRLTRGVAHEVKNPLNAMAIHLDLMREKIGPREPQLRPHLDVIRREIERLDRVVRTFLDFSRPVELRLAKIDLASVVQGVGSLIRADAERRGLELQLILPEVEAQVLIDRDLIEQALLNLANNGMQAMETIAYPPGGSRPRLTMEVLRIEARPAIRIRDEGAGVPGAMRERIFELYYTTRPEGTGAGLTLATRIMQLHHGALELEPGTGTGASFLLRFPLRTWGRDA